MIEYPKAMYKGTIDNYITKVVEDADEELKARSEGFVEYGYLCSTPAPKKTKKSNTVEASDNELHDTTSGDNELATS